MGSSIGNAFGKKDPNATNDMLGGKIVATGTPGAQTVADPNQGLDPEQARNRKLAALGGQVASGMSQQGQQQQPQGQAAPIQFAPQTQDLSSYFRPNPLQPKRNAFFGQ